MTEPSPNLRGANLRGANMIGADLRDANLRGANLRGANLDGVVGLAIASDAPQRLRAAAAPTIRVLCAALAVSVDYLLACIRDGSSDQATLEEIADRANTARDLLAAEPVEGEVGDRERLRIMAAGIRYGYMAGHIDTLEACDGDPDAVAAVYAPEILKELGIAPTPPAPVVVPVAILRFEFEVLDEHDRTVASGDAPTLEEAAREGHHYLQQYEQDGPSTLELRRVEVLNPDTIPLPQVGKGEG